LDDYLQPGFPERRLAISRKFVDLSHPTIEDSNPTAILLARNLCVRQLIGELFCGGIRNGGPSEVKPLQITESAQMNETKSECAQFQPQRDRVPLSLARRSEGLSKYLAIRLVCLESPHRGIRDIHIPYSQSFQSRQLR
jgi:hypothetical protein